MMSEITHDEIRSLISEQFPDFESSGNIQRLDGGNLNHVWRVEGRTRSLIIKHAPPYIASNPEIPLSSERISFEARALQLFSPSGQFHPLTSRDIRPPVLLHFDSEKSILIMEDLEGFEPLDEYSLKEIDTNKIGDQLGKLIGKLHAASLGDSDLRKSFNNKAVQETRHEVQYEPAHQFAKIDGVSEEEIGEIRKRTQRLGQALQKPGKSLIMGDLWPPSVFVGENNEVRVIDWEFVHFGRPLQDLGHWAAHCVMQEQMAETALEKENWNLLWLSFWDSYKQQVSNDFEYLVDQQEVSDFHIHLGAEILIRANGTFREGYIYGNKNEHLEQRKKAGRLAVDFILGNQTFKRF